MALHFKRNARFDVIFILTERELPVPGDCRLIPQRHLAFHHLSIICQDSMRDGILLLVGYKISELCVCCYGFFARKMVVQHGDVQQHPECQLAEQMLSDMFLWNCHSHMPPVHSHQDNHHFPDVYIAVHPSDVS